jgi:hypothetical protein
MAAVGVASLLLVVVMVGALRLEGAGAGDLNRLGVRGDLADLFRGDVGRATEAPARWQEEEAGPHCLILASGSDRHVVYRWEADRLVRVESAGDRTYRRHVGLGGDTAAAEFERPRDGGQLFTLRVYLNHKDGRRRRPAAEFTAALGGDLQ